MNVLFEKKFLRNINAIENKEIKLRTQQIIIEVENATSLNQVSNIKKLKGTNTHTAFVLVNIG